MLNNENYTLIKIKETVSPELLKNIMPLIIHTSFQILNTA